MFGLEIKAELGVVSGMNEKDPTKISPGLTIPEFDVKVVNEHYCHVTSKDGRYKFSAKIVGKSIQIYGPTFPKLLQNYVGSGGFTEFEFTTPADDVITHVTTSLRLMDKLSSDGFSTKIDRDELVISHSSKPDYELRMSITDIRHSASSTYGAIKYCGPGYDDENSKLKCKYINNYRMFKIDKDLEELSQELKARLLKLGEPDPRITQWVTEEIEKELTPHGIVFTPRLGKGIVELSHPSGLSGSFLWELFTIGNYFTNKQKCPNQHFPTDIEQCNSVLFTCDFPDMQERYTKNWLVSANEKEAVNTIRGILACGLVYQEVCKKWKSELVIPKLRVDGLHLVNTKMEGNNIILKLTQKWDQLILTSIGERFSYYLPDALSDDEPEKIARLIVEKIDKHVKKFIQKSGYKLANTKAVEIDL
jgi:hypothetical protein